MGDSWQPDAGQRIDPQGRVTYDFDGHVNARGLDLPAGGYFAAPDESRVRWLREDGTVLAVATAGLDGDSNDQIAIYLANGDGLGVDSTGQAFAYVNGIKTVLATADGAPYVAAGDPAQAISLTQRDDFGPPVTRWLDVTVAGNLIGSIEIFE